MDFEGNQDEFVILGEHRVRDPRNVVIATVGMLLPVTGGHLPASIFPRGIMRRSESLSALRFYNVSPTGWPDSGDEFEELVGMCSALEWGLLSLPESPESGVYFAIFDFFLLYLSSGSGESMCFIYLLIHF